MLGGPRDLPERQLRPEHFFECGSLGEWGLVLLSLRVPWS
jgi:hypothetical protein